MSWKKEEMPTVECENCGNIAVIKVMVLADRNPKKLVCPECKHVTMVPSPLYHVPKEGEFIK